MQSRPLQPETQTLIDDIFPSDFFELDPDEISSTRKPRLSSAAKSPSPSPVRSLGPGLLRGRDFVLPELIDSSVTGELQIRGGREEVEAEQIFRLAEEGDQPGLDYSELPKAEQQLEKRRYHDHLKRSPQKESERAARKEELEMWLKGGPQAEQNFLTWFNAKRQRRRTGLMRKANRLANCGVSGRRMDCTHHEEHKFYGEFKCQCRYCRRCGADIFSELFGKYVGLWSTVEGLLPRPGFRSQVIIATLDFTAVDLGRMATPREVREFNDDIRACIHRVTKALGIRAKDYGFLWCDEFGGWDTKKKEYNTNLHAHGVYVGPFLPQKELAKVWLDLRRERGGITATNVLGVMTRGVWIKRQKIDDPPRDFLECERRRFIRALGHALKYTGKHMLRSDGARLAELEIAFYGVRRVHTMGLFYRAPLGCNCHCAKCDRACEKANGHDGEHCCKHHGSQNLCPLCGSDLMFPSRESGYAFVADLRKEGRQNLGEVRARLARERGLNGTGTARAPAPEGAGDAFTAD